MYDKGLEIRTTVMGKAYVDKALNANTDDFGKPVQDYVTEYAWGAVWGREGLSRKTRSMLNLAMISILSRPHELQNAFGLCWAPARYVARSMSAQRPQPAARHRGSWRSSWG